MIACAKDSIIATKDDFLENDLNWLEVVSEFIEAWHVRLGEPRYSKSVNQVAQESFFTHLILKKEQSSNDTRRNEIRLQGKMQAEEIIVNLAFHI